MSTRIGGNPGGAVAEAAGGSADAAAGYLEALRSAGRIGGHDELFGGRDPAGPAAADPAWAPLLGTLSSTPHAELRRRWERARLMIADHGVTYRAYGDRYGAERPWRLDPVPVVIAPADWAALEAGLLQRAALMEALLADLHGPRRLLEAGVVPPALVLGNPGFFRSVRGLVPAGGRFLSLLGVDVARDLEGRWCVIGDRAAAPGGVGHALEHRVVVSRTLPTAFRASRVRRLTGWFDGLRGFARSLAPEAAADRAEPRVVLLTPGPAAAGHAEHAYLARSLGFTLVEPADLTVRKRVVCLKTLGGLERVDVIVRRTPDADGDPLELGTGGVPGLLQAQRAGNVVVTNAPGSGLVESPGLAGHLPAACRFLLGEPLLLPPAPTRWGGDAPPPEDLTDVVVKPAYAGPLTPGIGPSAAVFGTTVGEEAGEALRAAMRERPDAFAYQRSVPLSTTPAWDPQAPPTDARTPGGVRLTPRRLVLRTFVAATASGHAVMPGGLGRVTPGAASRLTSMRRGGGAKDVWVVLPGGPPAAGAEGEARSDAPAGPPADRAPGAAVEPAVRGTGWGVDRGVRLPSRVADNLFWLGRYAERAEGTVRLLRAIGHRHADPAEAHPHELGALLRALAVVTGVADADADDGASSSADPGGAGDVLAAIFEPRGPHGLQATLDACRGAGGLVRDRLSVDAWRILERLGRDSSRHALAAASVDPEDALADAVDLFDGLLLTLAAFAGHAHESFTHEEGWRFLDTGRRIERAVFTAELMRALLVRPVWLARAPAGPAGRAGAAASASEGLLLDALLEVGVSAMTYRARHASLPRILPVLDLLLFDGSNPRAIRWQLDAIGRHLAGLPDAAERMEDAEAGAGGHGLGAMLGGVSSADLVAVKDGRRVALEAVLGRIITGLPALSDDLSRAYVRLTPPAAG